MTSEVVEYDRRYVAHLTRVATNLESYVCELFDGLPFVDRICARAKEPERFAVKAAKVGNESVPKYPHPLTEIQDQLGVRVVVFYEGVVEPAARVVQRYFHAIEDRTLVPESHWAFGYFGRHYVLAVPRDVIPSDVSVDEVPAFFELQIKTLFQHAWSEAEHDLGYKSPSELEADEQRLLAAASAQAWSADRAFAELCASLDVAQNLNW
jgi:putative GTP pyrophosphokinase